MSRRNTTATDIEPHSQCSCSFLDAAKSQSFLVHAILAYTASTLAWENQTVGSKRLAYHHGGLALERLPVAVSRLNRENADAVLAASVLLARQANDW